MMSALGLSAHWCCIDSAPVFSESICEDRTTNIAKDFNIFYLKYLGSSFFFLKAKYVLKSNHLMSKQELILETLTLKLLFGFAVYSCFFIQAFLV